MKTDAISKGTFYIILSLGAFLMLFPFFWMISTSLMTPSEINAQNPRVWLPSVPQWGNYARA